MVHNATQFVHRVRESLKYRIFHGYCNTLRRIKTSHIPDIDWKPLNVQLPLFVTITRDIDIPMVRYCLHSMMQHVAVRPRLWLVGDSDIAYQELQAQLAEVPDGVELWHWETLLKQLPLDYQHFIQSWSQSPWNGYSKKFAIYLAANLQSDILYFDSDVLWHGDFLSRLEAIRQREQPTIIGGRDYKRTYDLGLAHLLNDRDLIDSPPFCAGLMYCAQKAFFTVLPLDKLQRTQACLEAGNVYYEQTLAAHAFWQLEGQWFEDEVLATTLADNFHFKSPIKSLIRHYAGGKHLFWRDAG